MKAVDFFCGAGGLTRGLLNAGIGVLTGFDIDEQSKYTYELNNKKSRFICTDIRDINASVLKSKTRLKNYDDILFAGCAPCQPFSSQRKGRGKHQNATLLGEFGRIIEETLPGIFLLKMFLELHSCLEIAHFAGF